MRPTVYGSIGQAYPRRPKSVNHYITNGQNVPDDIKVLDDIQKHLPKWCMGDDLGL